MMVSTPQAISMLRHYAPYVRVDKCEDGYPTVCSGTEKVCQYHGTNCIPISPVKYVFRLRWSNDKTKILVSISWTMSS